MLKNTRIKYQTQMMKAPKQLIDRVRIIMKMESRLDEYELKYRQLLIFLIKLILRMLVFQWMIKMSFRVMKLDLQLARWMMRAI